MAAELKLATKLYYGVGQLSDRFHSRWGRRHPFMLAGAVPFGLAIVALFSPPDGLGQMADAGGGWISGQPDY